MKEKLTNSFKAILAGMNKNWMTAMGYYSLQR